MQKKRIIILLFLITVSCALWLSLKQRPLYKASSTVVVNLQFLPAGDASGVAQAHNIYMETQKEIALSRRVAHHVIKNLGLHDSIDDILKGIKADIVKGAGLIKISAEAFDPSEASRLANEFAVVYANHKLSQVKPGSVIVQDFAGTPIKPIRPDKKSNILISAILAMAGIIILSFIKLPGGNIKLKDDELAELAVLGSIPKIKLSKRAIKTKKDLYRIAEKDPLCMASEAYRSIRVRLLSAKTIAITSPGNREGKTISAVNLAVMTAHSGESVLLVDANTRSPKVHYAFDMNNDTGLADYLSGDADFNSIIKHPGVDNLFIVTSGNMSHRPVKYISSKNMKLFLEKAGAGFSKVIFDAPSVPHILNMDTLLSSCDEIVLVANYKRHAVSLKKSEKFLQKKGANTIKVILNKVVL